MGRRERYIFVTEKPRHPARKFFRAVLLVLLSLILILGLMNFVQSNQVAFEKETVTVENLPSDLENFTIIYISDLRGKSFGSSQSTVTDAIGTRSYSCVVFGGDMIGDDGDTGPFLDLIAALPSDVTKMFIPGDNDPSLYDGTAHGSLSAYADWAQSIIEAGVIILDEPVKMTRGKKDIWFIPENLYGLDLDSLENAYQNQLNSLDTLAGLTPDEAAQRRLAQYRIEQIGRIREVQSSLTDSDIQIVVSHAPLTESYVAEQIARTDEDNAMNFRNAALILAGHYCGGQWRLPGLGAIWVPDLGFFPDDSLIEGLHDVCRIPQFIGKGLSTSSIYGWLPGRLFNEPAVTLITLTAKYT